MEQYRREWDDDRKAFRASALHDWTSHYADAFRYLALARQKNVPKPIPSPILRGLRHSATARTTKGRNVVMKKRRNKLTARRAVKKKLTLKQAYDRQLRRSASDRNMMLARFLTIIERMEKIESEQRTIAWNVDAVMKDYIRHPLKIDGMNQAAFRSLVEAAARNYPQMFKDDFNGRLEASDD